MARFANLHMRMVGIFSRISREKCRLLSNGDTFLYSFYCLFRLKSIYFLWRSNEKCFST